MENPPISSLVSRNTASAIATQHAAVALRQSRFGLGGDLRHCLTPGSTSGGPKVRTGNLCPGECRNCYNDTDLHASGRLLYLAVGKFAPSQRPLIFNMTPPHSLYKKSQSLISEGPEL